MLELKVKYLKEHSDCAVVTADAWIVNENNIAKRERLISNKNPNRFDRNHFYQALMCMDMNLKPNDLRIDEQIAISMTYDYIGKMQKENKKNFSFLNEEITGAFKEFKEDPEIQTEMIRYSKQYDEKQREEGSGFNIEDYFKSSNMNQNRDMER